MPLDPRTAPVCATFNWQEGPIKGTQLVVLPQKGQFSIVYGTLLLFFFNRVFSRYICIFSGNSLFANCYFRHKWALILSDALFSNAWRQKFKGDICVWLNYHRRIFCKRFWTHLMIEWFQYHSYYFPWWNCCNVAFRLLRIYCVQKCFQVLF